MDQVPRIYCGVWKRTLLEGGGLATDRSSLVLWLQTPSWHADIRLPKERAERGAQRFADCTAADIRRLAQQQGFSGITRVAEDVCEWHRDVDFQPDTGTRDVGRMLFLNEDRLLEEYGVEADYHETWERLPEGEGPCACWERRHPSGRIEERLLVAGDCFFLVRNRSTPLPVAEPGRHHNLTALVLQTPHKAVAWLDLTLAFGRIAGSAEPWQILHATLPWLEGRTLSEAGIGAGSRWTLQLQEAGAPTPPFEGA